MKLDNLWKRIHEMTESELEEYAKSHQCKLDGTFEDEEEAADAICLALGIERSDDVDSSPGSKLDKLAREHQRRNPDLSYEKCLGAMRKQNPHLAEAYVQSFGPGKAAAKR
jgi:hypothetical protein